MEISVQKPCATTESFMGYKMMAAARALTHEQVACVDVDGHRALFRSYAEGHVYAMDHLGKDVKEGLVWVTKGTQVIEKCQYSKKEAQAIYKKYRAHLDQALEERESFLPYY